MTGVAWSAFAHRFRLQTDPAVNYLATFEAPGGAEEDRYGEGGAAIR